MKQQGFSCGSVVKNPPAKQETQVQSLGQEDPLEKGMASHSSIFAQRIPWTEEPGGLQSMGSQKSRTRLRDYITGETNRNWESCVTGLGHNSGTTGKKGLQVKQAHPEGSEYAGKREGYWAKDQELEGVGEGMGCLRGRKASWEYAEDVFDTWVGKSSSRSLNFWWSFPGRRIRRVFFAMGSQGRSQQVWS